MVLFQILLDGAEPCILILAFTHVINEKWALVLANNPVCSSAVLQQFDADLGPSVLSSF